MRLLILLVPLLLLAAWTPGWWVRHTMKKYHRPADRYDGTGAELARELLDRHGLHKVQVETTKDGDHYDPASRTVRLSPENHDGHSLTAITVPPTRSATPYSTPRAMRHCACAARWSE